MIWKQVYVHSFTWLWLVWSAFIICRFSVQLTIRSWIVALSIHNNVTHAHSINFHPTNVITFCWSNKYSQMMFSNTKYCKPVYLRFILAQEGEIWLQGKTSEFQHSKFARKSSTRVIPSTFDTSPRNLILMERRPSVVNQRHAVPTSVSWLQLISW